MSTRKIAATPATATPRATTGADGVARRTLEWGAGALSLRRDGDRLELVGWLGAPGHRFGHRVVVPVAHVPALINALAALAEDAA